MSFEKMKLPPGTSLYINHAAIENMAVLPTDDFFIKEIVHWRKYGKNASPLDPLDKGIVEHLVDELRTLTTGRNFVPQMMLSRTPEAYAEGQRWLAGALSRIAFSRFWHEKHFLEDIEVEFGNPDQAPTVCGDLPTEDFSKGGLHAHQGLVENMSLTYPSPGAPTWHEGEQVFVRVSTPAVVTQECLDGYREEIKQPFPAGQLATIVPFIKREIWENSIAIENI